MPRISSAPGCAPPSAAAPRNLRARPRAARAEPARSPPPPTPPSSALASPSTTPADIRLVAHLMRQGPLTTSRCPSASISDATARTLARARRHPQIRDRHAIGRQHRPWPPGSLGPRARRCDRAKIAAARSRASAGVAASASSTLRSGTRSKAACARPQLVRCPTAAAAVPGLSYSPPPRRAGCARRRRGRPAQPAGQDRFGPHHALLRTSPASPSAAADESGDPGRAVHHQQRIDS